MAHIEGHLKNARGQKIYHQSWVPEDKLKAQLLIVHGLGEHGGRYQNIVKHFLPRGFSVNALDHIGHGKSDGGREEIERFGDFTDPINMYYDHIKGVHPGVPVFLVGHSLGGLIACYHLLDSQDKFKAAVISAAPVRIPSNITPFTVLMGKVLSSIAPKIGVLGLDPHSVSRDSKVVEAYINDPLVFHGKTPARLSAEMLMAMKRVTAEMQTISLPLLVVQGSADKLVDPVCSQALFDGVSSQDKQIKLYSGYYHEVFNDPGHEVVLKDMEDWLTARL